MKQAIATETIQARIDELERIQKSRKITATIDGYMCENCGFTMPRNSCTCACYHVTMHRLVELREQLGQQKNQPAHPIIC